MYVALNRYKKDSYYKTRLNSNVKFGMMCRSHRKSDMVGVGAGRKEWGGGCEEAGTAPADKVKWRRQ